MSEGTPILVTGGAGYIGSHACKLLAGEGYLPVTIDNLSTGHADAVRWGPFIKGDVRDPGLVGDVLKKHGIVTVMHFAASAYVGESVKNPSLYYNNNIGGMTALLDACVEAGVGRFILSSSCATYGVPERLPITEDTRQAPINPYGWTKLACERMLADYGRAYGIRHVALRYFNACGADPDGVLSERHAPETHLIPLALIAAAGGEPISIFGSDYDTPDGTCIRDYIHVSDLAAGHLAACRYLAAGGSSLTVNLGSGRGYSVREVVEAVGRVTGVNVPSVAAKRREGDPPILVADPSQAGRVLGFRAERSEIDTIIADAAPGFGLRRKNDGAVA